MSIISCLLKKAELGRITKKTAENIKSLLEDYKTKVAGGRSDLAAEMDVAEQAYKVVQSRLAQKVKQVAVHADVLEKFNARIDDALTKGVPLEQAVRSINITTDGDAFKYGYLGDSGFERIEATKDIYKSMLVNAFEELKPKGAFSVFRSPKDIKEIVQDMYAAVKGVGRRSADERVRLVTDTFKKVTDLGAADFERAGGNITARKDYILGIHHDTDKLVTAGENTWVADIKPLLNIDLMADWLPEVRSPEVLDGILRHIYRHHISGGMIDIGDYVPKGLRSVVNMRNHHRFLDFVDADAYLKYHEKYGSLDLYNHMMRYADRVGRDIGTLETYGPKPEAIMNSLKRKIANLEPENADKIARRFEQEFRFVTGLWDRSVDPKLAKVLSTARAANTAGKLGATVIDALVIETTGLSAVAEQVRGLPVLNTLVRDLKLFGSFKNLDPEYKAWAKHALYVEAFLDEAAANLRAAEAEGAEGFFNTAATAVLKYSGLTRKTHTKKGAVVEQLALELAEKTWEELPDNLRSWLGMQGIDKNFLNSIKAHVADYDLGLKIISPSTLYEAGLRNEATKIAGVFSRAAEAVSPTANPKVRAAFANFERGGLIPQFLGGSAKTFTGYPFSFFENHLKVAFNVKGYGNKAKILGAYATALIVGATAATIIRDALNGKKPRLDGETVQRAIARAGIVPLISDFIFSGGNTYGRNIYDSLVGVNVGAISDLGSAAKKAFVDAPMLALQGESDKSGKKLTSAANDFMKVLQGFIPGQNHWLTGLAFKRLIMDQLREVYDPEAAKAFRRQINKEEKLNGGYWWKPGETLPEFLK